MEKLKYYFYKIYKPIRHAYWRVFKPKTSGVKSIIEHNNKFLMIRNVYGATHWTFPGGDVKSWETPEQAAIREAFEEVGILIKNPKYLGSYYTERRIKKDTVHCFYKQVSSFDFKIDPAEILEAAWFDQNSLPNPLSPSVPDTLNLLNY